MSDEALRRKHPFTRQCSSCGADIVWFRTAAGKRMPVDEASTLPTDAMHQSWINPPEDMATCAAYVPVAVPTPGEGR